LNRFSIFQVRCQLCTTRFQARRPGNRLTTQEFDRREYRRLSANYASTLILDHPAAGGVVTPISIGRCKLQGTPSKKSDTPSYGSKDWWIARARALETQCQSLHEDLLLMQISFDKRCRQARLYAEGSGNPALVTLCQKEQREIEAEFVLRRSAKASEVVVPLRPEP